MGEQSQTSLFLVKFKDLHENILYVLKSLVQLTSNMSRRLTTIEINVTEIKLIVTGADIETGEDGYQSPLGNDQQPPPDSFGAPPKVGPTSTITPLLPLGSPPSNSSPPNNTPPSSSTP